MVICLGEHQLNGLNKYLHQPIKYELDQVLTSPMCFIITLCLISKILPLIFAHAL